MTSKQAFLNELDRLMAGMPEDEQVRLKDYFTEMIDDRMEMGMPEADAVSALGEPEALLRDAAPMQLPAVQAGGGSADYRDAIREIHIHVKGADAVVKRAPLPDGMTAQINASQSNLFKWDLTDGVLTITEAGEVRRILFGRSAKLTLILPELIPDVLIVNSYGGDIEVDGLQVETRAVLATSSGDISMNRFGCQGRIELTTRSGDLSLSEIEAYADCKLEALSGDIELKRVNANRLRLRTASGDIEGSQLRVGTLAAGTASGDIEIDNATAETSILCESTSGDINLMRASAPDIRTSATSSDICVRAASRPEGYDIDTATRSGDTDISNPFPTGPNPAKLSARSVSGDIDVRVL